MTATVKNEPPTSKSNLAMNGNVGTKMQTYHAEIDGGRGGETNIMAPNMVDAHRLAEQWVWGGDWSMDAEGDVTVYARLTLSTARGSTETSWVRIDPCEPPCVSPSGHDWQDGQSYGVGGGVKGTDTCTRCAVRRHWTTWANRVTTADGETGEQGVESISYDRAENEEAEP